jgi:hypothetical protein
MIAPILMYRAENNIRKRLYVSTTGTDRPSSGRGQRSPFQTITYALSRVLAGDVIAIMPGSYDEQVTIAAAKSGISLIGLGNRGSVCIAPSGTNKTALTVSADDVTLINIGCEGDGTGGGLVVSDDVARFRAYGCKLEGGALATKLIGVGDLLMDDCEYCWTASGLLFAVGAEGFCTQVKISRPRFHNCETVCAGLATNGGVVNLDLSEGVFDNAEDGTPPTDYIKIDRVGDTGIISGCRFATATNAAAVLTIAAGIMWVGNVTEAGVSAARPGG